MLRLSAARRVARFGQELTRQKLGKSQGCVTNFVRQYWNKDYEANPQYPETEAEREAAAKSYGMLPEDYKPIKNDGSAFGDYPELPWKGADSRSPWEDWDYPSLRRNFNEPLNLHADILGEDRYQPDAKDLFTMPQMYLILTTVIAVFAGLAYLGEQYKTPQCTLVKQSPYSHIYSGKEPLQHFTFEPAE